MFAHVQHSHVALVAAAVADFLLTNRACAELCTVKLQSYMRVLGQIAGKIYKAIFVVDFSDMIVEYIFQRRQRS